MHNSPMFLIGVKFNKERRVPGAERNRGPAIEDDVKRYRFAGDCHATLTVSFFGD